VVVKFGRAICRLATQFAEVAPRWNLESHQAFGSHHPRIWPTSWSRVAVRDGDVPTADMASIACGKESRAGQVEWITRDVSHADVLDDVLKHASEKRMARLASEQLHLHTGHLGILWFGINRILGDVVTNGRTAAHRDGVFERPEEELVRVHVDATLGVQRTVPEEVSPIRRRDEARVCFEKVHAAVILNVLVG